MEHAASQHALIPLNPFPCWLASREPACWLAVPTGQDAHAKGALTRQREANPRAARPYMGEDAQVKPRASMQPLHAGCFLLGTRRVQACSPLCMWRVPACSTLCMWRVPDVAPCVCGECQHRPPLCSGSLCCPLFVLSLSSRCPLVCCPLLRHQTPLFRALSVY